MITDYYSILGITKNANLDEIKKAFRTEIAIYHPENNSNLNAKEKFDSIIEAFNVLSDAKKRRAYDDMLYNSETNKPVIATQKQEETYRDWQKEAKNKSDKSWESSLTDLLLLDLFFDISFGGLFDGIGDELGDAIGDIFDLF